MLRDAREQLRKGIEVSSAHKTKYEDIRAILVADYVASGRATLDGDEFLIAGRRGLLKPLDNYFAGMKVAHITTDVLRKFSEQRFSRAFGGAAPAKGQRSHRPPARHQGGRRRSDG